MPKGYKLNKKPTIICETCNQVKEVRDNWVAKVTRFCSRGCKRHTDETKSRIRDKKLGQKVHSKEWREELRQRMIGNEFRKGHPLSDEHKKKMIKFSEEHHQWKGNDASYSAKHKWVNKYFGKPRKCEDCGFESKNNRQFHWANISGGYLRDRSDWLRLCVPCHKEFDKNYH